MTRRPIFWVVFSALGLAGAIAAVQLFTVALPNVSLDISMDREAAMADASSLARQMGWGPDSARAAASFGQVDSEVQTYVELEGGGRDAFQDLMDAGVYQPYQWQVRLFAEGQVAETRVRFAPAGEPYGFRARLAEDDPGAGNLDEAQARSVAEEAGTAWPVDLGQYSLLESSEEEQPGGRVDHTFVYERQDVTLAEARFRLRLVVAGDRLTELTHFVFVPEAFSRRYADMRSTNDAIALVSSSIFMLIFVLLGAGVGSALLLRRRWIEWRTALAWGAASAALFGLNAINALPLAWMGYDTALSSKLFVFQNIASAGAIALLGAPVLAFFFLAGESLGRKAFPEHLQQWRFWNRDVAASNTALGMTVGAYILVALELGYVILFYLGTARLDGWWSPADALVQPDLLATYFPWLQAVSISLFAAFWEESIFRAVPIACAALIGARYGRKNMWIWGMVAFQAVVFAAGHANYPQQPAYARVIELSLPAFVWGSVYVFFGLVPTIITHFLYDLALISSVLFASDAVVDQFVIVLVGAIPLAVVLWARRGGRGTAYAPPWAFNGAWSPRPVPEPPPAESLSLPESSASSVAEKAAPVDAAARLPLPAALFKVMGAVGFALWLGALMVDKAPPRFEVTRLHAIEIANEALTSSGHDMSGWTPGTFTGGGASEGHEYVFAEAGFETFDALAGDFLSPPQWVVRYVDWTADPEDRVEEFLVNLNVDGSLRRIVHTLPEGRVGAMLGAPAARRLAEAALPPGDWEEVGAEETTHEARTDWNFTFRDRAVLTEVDGEGRAAVSVLGDEVGNVRRFVHIPEEWQRARRDSESRRSILGVGLIFTLILMFGVAAIVAIVVWSRGGLKVGPVWKGSALAAVALGMSVANEWPVTVSRFLTSQPYGFQVGGAALGLLLVTVIAGAAIGLVIALGHSWAEPEARVRPPQWVGISMGLIVAGAGSFAAAFLGGMPTLPDYSGVATFIPLLSPPIDMIVPLLFVTSALLLLAVAMRRFRGHPFLGSVTGYAVLALGIVIVPTALQDSLVMWVGGGLVGAAAIYGLVHVIGLLPALAPIVFGTVVFLDALESVLDRAYSGAMLGYLLAAMIVAVLARAWSNELAAAPSESSANLPAS